MTTNMYRHLYPGSRDVGMVLRNLSVQEVLVPPKMVIGSRETVKKVPEGGLLNHTVKDLPPSEQRELPEGSWTSSPELMREKVTQLTPGSSQLEAPIPEPDILGEVDLSGYTKWDPDDELETQSILRV